MIQINLNLLYTMINLIVLFLILRHFLIAPVTAVMEKRKKLIEDGLMGARQANEEADSLKKQYEDVLKHAGEESARMLEEAKVQARHTYDRMVGEATQQAQMIVGQAKQTALLEQEKALAQVKAQTAGLAMDAARALLSGAKGQTGDFDSNLYDTFLKGESDAGESGDGYAQ